MSNTLNNKIRIGGKNLDFEDILSFLDPINLCQIVQDTVTRRFGEDVAFIQIS